MTEASQQLFLPEALDLAERALVACGCDLEAAKLLAEAVIESEAQGYPGVGLSHLLDYCDGLVSRRLNGSAQPVIHELSSVVLRVDGDRGIPHLSFARVLDELVQRAEEHGMSLFLSYNAFTCAALGYFTQRLAERDVIAFAATNGSPASMAGSGTSKPVFSTNPISFSVPRGAQAPLVIDQSSSATALVNISQAAREGRSLPPGWAVDVAGKPTLDPQAAVAGALLPAGGARGANLALMVEILAAGLCGANWSLDASESFHGAISPDSGLFVLAIHPRISGNGTVERIDEHLHRLAGEFGAYLPGERREASVRIARERGIWVQTRVLESIRDYAAGAATDGG